MSSINDIMDTGLYRAKKNLCYCKMSMNNNKNKIQEYLDLRDLIHNTIGTVTGKALRLKQYA